MIYLDFKTFKSSPNYKGFIALDNKYDDSKEKSDSDTLYGLLMNNLPEKSRITHKKFARQMKAISDTLPDKLKEQTFVHVDPHKKTYVSQEFALSLANKFKNKHKYAFYRVPTAKEMHAKKSYINTKVKNIKQSLTDYLINTLPAENKGNKNLDLEGLDLESIIKKDTSPNKVYLDDLYRQLNALHKKCLEDLEDMQQMINNLESASQTNELLDKAIGFHVAIVGSKENYELDKKLSLPNFDLKTGKLRRKSKKQN